MINSFLPWESPRALVGDRVWSLGKGSTLFFLGIKLVVEIKALLQAASREKFKF